MTSTAPILERIPLDFLPEVEGGIKPPESLVLPHADAFGYLLTGAAAGQVVVGDTLYDLTHDVIPVMEEAHLAQLVYRAATIALPDDHTEADPHGGATMMAAMCNAHAKTLLDYTFKGTPPTTTPASLSQGISTVDPGWGTTAAGTSDPTPQAVTFTTTAGSGATPGSWANTAAVTWSGLTAGTYAYTYTNWVAAVTQALTMVERWALNAAVQVLGGQAITAAASALSGTRG